ncbi:MAG: tRNA lysidine(34) synthetase TilS [Rickettsiaceae bacterium]
MQNLEQILFSNLKSLLGKIYPQNISIAVSGGSDSICLLFLMDKIKRLKLLDINLHIITVDHNLRPKSKEEAMYVKQISNQLGYECDILSWDCQNNISNIQSRARDGRYHLMTNLCNKLDILILLTAHHKDDCIENFVMRKMRKYSSIGLMPNIVHFNNNVKILRPLFNIAKEEIVNYLTSNRIGWIEDESNISDKYQRNIIRKNLIDQGNSVEGIILNDFTLNNNEDNKLYKLIASAVDIYQYGFAIIDTSYLIKYQDSFCVQIINFVLAIISGKNTIPKYKSIKKIILSILSLENFICTIHSCVVKKINGKIIVYKEFGRILPQDVECKNATTWNNRFEVINQVLMDHINNVYITHLTANDYALIKDQIDLESLKLLSMNHHKKILFTLPVIKILEKVIALPHISYYSDVSFKNKIKVHFKPNFISRFTHFINYRWKDRG